MFSASIFSTTAFRLLELDVITMEKSFRADCRHSSEKAANQIAEVLYNFFTVT